MTFLSRIKRIWEMGDEKLEKPVSHAKKEKKVKHIPTTDPFIPRIVKDPAKSIIEENI